MELVIGVVGMVVLAGIYVALGLADRGEDGCEGCLLRDDLEGGCLGCPELRDPGITRTEETVKAARSRGTTRTGGSKTRGVLKRNGDERFRNGSAGRRDG